MGHLKNTRYINIPAYNVSMEDDILNLDTSIGITLVFPNVQDSGCMYADKRWYVNDATGGAAANPVTITAVSGIQINDAASQQLSTANFGACVFATNQQKYVITGSGGSGGTTIVTSPFTPSNTAIIVGDDFQEVAEKAQGQINDIVTNVTTLQNNEYKITYFAEISAASGTITKPTGSTILLDQFAGGVDAYVSTITNGQPTGDFPTTAGGVVVDVTSFDASGNFVLSGTPSAYPCALIYVIKISAVDLSNALISNRLDLENVDVITQTITNGDTTHAPSGGAVFDALALKANLTDLPYDISAYRKTGTGTFERWYNNSINCTALSTISLVRDVVRYYPLIISKACTLDRIGVEITGAGTVGSVVRLGIYNSSNLLPTTLVINAGTILGDSATAQSITINQLLQPDLYFIASNHNSVANITLRSVTVSSCPNVLGFPNTMGATLATGYFVIETYGSFNDPATTPTGILTGTPLSTYFRLSA